MKTNQEKEAEAKIKVGNRYIQILLDNFEELRGKFKRDNSMFSSGFITVELKDLDCRFRTHSNRGGCDYNLRFKTESKDGGFCLYFDSEENLFDKIENYPNSVKLIDLLKEEWKRIENDENEESAQKRLINLEKQFAELNVIFPQE